MESTPPLAALTTVFSPPCQTTWLITTTKIPSQYPPFPTGGPASCNPPEWPANIADQGFQYYSPAICPSGFAVGPDCEVEDTRIAEEEFPAVLPGERAFYCVPSGYTCTSDTTDFRGGVWGYTVSGPTGRTADCTVGPALQIRWKDEDLDMLETHPLTPGSAEDDRTDVFVLPPPSPTRLQTTAVMMPPPITTEETSEATPLPETSAREMPDTSEPMKTRFSTVVTTVIAPGGSSTVVTATTAVSASSATMSGTSRDGPGAMPTDSPTSPESNEDGNKIIDNPTALATVFLSSLIAGMALLAIAYVIYRRYRKAAARRGDDGPEQVGIGVWVQRSGQRLQAVSELQGSSPSTTWSSWRTRAELGTDGPTPELNARWPLGTRANPAELDGGEAGSPYRWSWLSHVSTKLSIGSKKSARARPENRAASRRTLSTASNSSTSSTSTSSSLTSEKALLSVFNPRNQRE